MFNHERAKKGGQCRIYSKAVAVNQSKEMTTSSIHTSTIQKQGQSVKTNRSADEVEFLILSAKAPGANRPMASFAAAIRSVKHKKHNKHDAAHKKEKEKETLE